MPVVRYPDPVLRAKCSEVPPDEATLHRGLVEQMVLAMYAEGGVGLAAPQLGHTRRIVVIDPSGGDDPSSLVVMINPRVTWRSSEVASEKEGCLSIPGVAVEVVRPCAVVVGYLDGSRALSQRDVVGIAARIVQHEVDHLDGRLTLDAAGPLARRLAMKEIRRKGLA